MFLRVRPAGGVTKIDRELDALLDGIEEEIESRGEASTELMEKFQEFCEAHSEKADRIGRFVRMMDARVHYCRSEANRLQERARSCERKATQTKYMVMYYLKSRDLKKIEGRESRRIFVTARNIMTSYCRVAQFSRFEVLLKAREK
jgi:hypothetical protein